MTKHNFRENNGAISLAEALGTKVHFKLELASMEPHKAKELMSSVPTDYDERIKIEHADPLTTVLFRDVVFSRSDQGKLLMRLPAYSRYGDRSIVVEDADETFKPDVSYTAAFPGRWDEDNDAEFRGRNPRQTLSVLRHELKGLDVIRVTLVASPMTRSG